MASVITKFGIGDTFYTFDPDLGLINNWTVIGVGISGAGGVSMAPDICYRAVNSNQSFSESDCLDASEVTDLGNAWLANKSTSMFTSVGL
jgi:hypothetical protein